jgi:hypothetical protein
MAARYKAIADAFARVVVSTSYRDKWITDHDFVRIIACEYDLAIDDTIKFDVVMLNRALKNDTRYSLAEDQDGCEAGTVFRKHYTPNVAGSNQRRTVFCYCIGNQPRLRPCGKWSDTISSFSLRSLRKRCGILVEQAEMFRKAIASTTTPVKRKHVAAIELVSVTKALPTHDIAAAIHPPIENVVPPPTVASPFTRSQVIRKPRLSKSVIEARSGPSRMQWDTGDTAVAEQSGQKIRRIAKDLEDSLQIDSGNDTAMAGVILSNMLQRQSMSEVKTLLTNQLSKDESTIEVQIATCIQSFLEHHQSKGPRKKCEQDAVDAVLVACSFGNINAASVANRLGTNRSIVQECKDRGQYLRDNDQRFEPAERQQRSDCYRDAATESVHAFCHSEEGSRLDTQSYRVFNTSNLDTGKTEKHPLRVWNTLGLGNRHRSFLESKTYKRFIEINPGKTIGIEVFRLSVYKCVRDPTPESCVDLLFSGLYEYMKAIKQGISTRKVIHKKIEQCECERHKNSREESVFDDEDASIMWEKLLAGRPIALIEATCCKKKEEPMLCSEVGREPPYHIPWACTSVDKDGKAQCEK